MYWYLWRKTMFLVGHFNKIMFNETHLLDLFLFELFKLFSGAIAEQLGERLVGDILRKCRRYGYNWK